MATDTELHMFADILAKKGTNLARRRRVPNLARRKKGTQFGERGMQKRKRRKGTQFGERVGHGDWLIGPKLFRPEAYPTCVSSKLCEFILFGNENNIE